MRTIRQIEKKIIKSFVALYFLRNVNLRMTIQFNFCTFFSAKNWCDPLCCNASSISTYWKFISIFITSVALSYFCWDLQMTRVSVFSSSRDNAKLGGQEYFWKQSVFPGCNPFIFSEITEKKMVKAIIFCVFSVVVPIISWEKPQKCRKLG